MGFPMNDNDNTKHDPRQLSFWELAEGVSEQIVRAVEGAQRVTCPLCGAAAGDACTNNRTGTHFSRVLAARLAGF